MEDSYSAEDEFSQPIFDKKKPEILENENNPKVINKFDNGSKIWGAYCQFTTGNFQGDIIAQILKSTYDQDQNLTYIQAMQPNFGLLNSRYAIISAKWWK